MNLDALIEDLEAEGYFASNVGEETAAHLELCRLVLVMRENLPDLYLSIPLLGKDFIAGFKVIHTKSSWQVFQDYQLLESQDHGTKLQQTRVSLQELIKKHLIGTSVKISLSVKESEVSGYIVGVSGKLIDFVTFDAKRLWIPVKSIKHMVVEKLSM
jgi:hypothetical protein